MFNWYTLPSFGAMLLFWMLGAYVLTRSPRSLISLAAVGALFATGAFLLSSAMAANTVTPEAYATWIARGQWGATVAPFLWYALTTLLLREQDFSNVRRYLMLLAYPLGTAIGLIAVVLTFGLYSGNLLQVWDQIDVLPPRKQVDSHLAMAVGPLYDLFVGYIAIATIGGAINSFILYRLPLDEDRHRRFRWLLLTSLIFIVGANILGILNHMTDNIVPTWVGHLILAAAMVVMAWNVAAYSLLIKGQVIRRDFLYFITIMTLVCVLYGVVFAAFGDGYSPAHLGLAAVMLVVVIVTHSFTDIGRQALDRLFYGEDVQHLRANLASTIQSAGMTVDLPSVLNEAQEEIAQVSAAHIVRLTEQALRRLNNPAALADCGLIDQLPSILFSARAGPDATPLERARALRDVLTATIDQLKPPDGDGIGAPAALQYHILREEYLQGLLNKQIMARHSISEGTFNRNRRQAIATLARELENQEQRLAGTAEPLRI